MTTSHLVNLFLGFGLPGHSEWLILLALGLLIFGRRLPEVGRNIGRSIVEFKRGIKGIGDEIEEESSREARREIADESTKDSLPHAARTEETAAAESASKA